MGVKVYNDLPLDVRRIEKYGGFTEELKRFFQGRS